MIATALTFLKNFKLPCLWIALIASALGAFASYKITHAVMQNQVTAAQLDLQNYRAEVLKTTVDGQVQVAALQKESANADAESLQRAIAAFSGRPALDNDRIAMRTAQTVLEGLHNDPTFACRFTPLPDAVIDGMRLPAE